MENIIIAVVLLAIAWKSTKNDLTYLMITGCMVAWLIDWLDFDIALYYSINSTLFALLGLYAVKLKTTSSIIYAIIMLIQVFFCLLLIPDWGNAGNTIIQNLAIYLNDGILTSILLLGVTGSGNSISNGFNNNRSGGCVNNHINSSDS